MKEEKRIMVLKLYESLELAMKVFPFPENFTE